MEFREEIRADNMQIDCKELMDKSGGTYILILNLKNDRPAQIGKLGRLTFKAGSYGYVGSAFGPGGLISRLKHHIKLSRKPHWHIDYFRRFANPTYVWFSKKNERLEHEWAAAMYQMQHTFLPIKGFGSTDCSCISHLFYFLKQPCFHLFQGKIKNQNLSCSNIYDYFF
ncbi:GIY-YIG nuclease family protein [bacterium]|nr:MAG: GIY-YIG nuclease family protein [bacterium]